MFQTSFLHSEKHTNMPVSLNHLIYTISESPGLKEWCSDFYSGKHILTVTEDKPVAHRSEQ
jgi:hypothetical protein